MAGLGAFPPPLDGALTGSPSVGYVPGSDPFLDAMYQVAPQAPTSPAAPDQAAATVAVDPGAGQAQPAAPPVDASLLGAPAADALLSPVQSEGQGALPPEAPAPPPIQLPFAQPAPAQEAQPASVRDLPDITVATEQPGEFTPDALTGAGERLKPGQRVPVGPNLTPEQHYQQTIGQYAADPFSIPDAGEQQRYLNDLASRSPEAFAAAQIKHENDRQQYINQRRQALADADYEAQKQAIEDKRRADEATQRKLDEVLADADRLSKTKIDRTGGLSGFSAIAGVLGSIVGGLVQGRTGAARNAGADALDAIINRGIESQKSDIANRQQGLTSKRNALTDELARHGDLYRAQDALRVASYNHAIGQLQTEAQNYDPRGTTALRIAQTTQEIQARRASAIESINQKNFDNEIKRQQVIREAALADSTIAKNRADIAKTYAETSKLRAEASAGDQLLTPAQIHQQFPNLPIEAIPPNGATAKQLGQHVETFNKTLDTEGKARANSPTERARELSVSGIVDNKGDPVLFRDVSEARTFGASKANVDDIVRTTDELVSLIRKNGPQFFKTPEWRKAQSNYSSLLLKAKEDDHLGVLSGSDVELEAKKIGTSDPTEIRDAIPGLLQFRHNVIEGFNAKLRTPYLPEGRSVKRYDPAAPPTEAAPADQLTGRTAIEQGQDAAPNSAIGKYIVPQRSLLDLALSDHPTAEGGRELSAEESARVGATGLALEDDAKVRATIKEATSAKGAAKQQALERLSIWSQSPRPSLASGVLGLVRGENPKLYGELVSKLPQEQRDAVSGVLSPEFQGVGPSSADLPPLPKIQGRPELPEEFRDPGPVPEPPAGTVPRPPSAPRYIRGGR